MRSYIRRRPELVLDNGTSITKRIFSDTGVKYLKMYRKKSEHYTTQKIHDKVVRYGVSLHKQLSHPALMKQKKLNSHTIISKDAGLELNKVTTEDAKKIKAFLKYLDRKKYVHTDIKSRNIVRNKHGKVTFIDLESIIPTGSTILRATHYPTLIREKMGGSFSNPIIPEFQWALYDRLCEDVEEFFGTGEAEKIISEEYSSVHLAAYKQVVSCTTIEEQKVQTSWLQRQIAVFGSGWKALRSFLYKNKSDD